MQCVFECKCVPFDICMCKQTHRSGRCHCLSHHTVPSPACPWGYCVLRGSRESHAGMILKSSLIPTHHPSSHLITTVIYLHIRHMHTQQAERRANRCIMGDGVERNPGLVKAREITPEQIYQLHSLNAVA